jgi:hypothetical protein
LCCLSVFGLRILITPLVSSSFSLSCQWPQTTTYELLAIGRFWQFGAIGSLRKRSEILSRVLSTHEGVINAQSSSRTSSGRPVRGILSTTNTLYLIAILQYWFRIDLVIYIILYVIKTFNLGAVVVVIICNQCLYPLKLWVQIPLMTRCTPYNIMWFAITLLSISSLIYIHEKVFNQRNNVTKLKRVLPKSRTNKKGGAYIASHMTIYYTSKTESTASMV